MKNLILTISVLFLAIACKNPQSVSEEATGEASIELPSYPDALEKVFAKHGGLERWRKMKALTYQIVKKAGNETHYIDLQNRRDRVEGVNFKMGYDGEKVWLEAEEDYKGNPGFYHNLMFYFYAMPFVLADDGIIYSEAEPLEFEGRSYPGVKIAYEANVGASPDDEYFIHYDPETYQMSWLGYTVTYHSKEKSEKVNWIRYDDWKTYKGLVLPASISWFKVEEGALIEPRNTVQFDEIVLSEEVHSDDVFALPEGAEIVD